MIDFVLGALFVALVVRGWMKGLVREALDVATLLLGALLAFRFSGAVGNVLSAMTGIAPEAARMVGGFLAFLAISIGAAFVSGLIHRTIKRLPAMTTLNRLGGAALGGIYALVLATLAVTLMSVVPLPATLAKPIDESVIAGRLTDPEGPVQRGVETLAGDRAIQSVISLRRIFGERTVVGGPAVVLPAAAGETRPSSAAADEVFGALNAARVDAGLDPLAWSDELAVIAVSRADAAYHSGTLSVASPSLEEVLDRSGVPHVVGAENLALAGSAAGVHEAIVGSDRHRSEVLGERYRRVGVGVVEGPYGLMAVQVFAG